MITEETYMKLIAEFRKRAADARARAGKLDRIKHVAQRGQCFTEAGTYENCATRLQEEHERAAK